MRVAWEEGGGDINSNSGCIVCLGLVFVWNRMDSQQGGGGSMCFIYKYSHVFTTNTEHSKAVPNVGVVNIVARSPTHTHTHISTRTLQKHLDPWQEI